MSITLSDLARDTRKIEIEWDGETMGLTYRPGEYTPEMESAFVESLNSNLPGNAFARILSKLIVSWEMLDDGGQEVPHDYETLAQIYTVFLTHVFNAITEDQTSAREDRKNSGGGSPKRAKSVTARSGTR